MRRYYDDNGWTGISARIFMYMGSYLGGVLLIKLIA